MVVFQVAGFPLTSLMNQARCLSRSLATLLSWKMESTGFVFHISTLHLHTVRPTWAWLTLAALFLVVKASWLATLLLSGFGRPIRSTTPLSGQSLNSQLPCDQNATDLCTTSDITHKSDVASHNHESETRRAPPHFEIGGIFRNCQRITTQGFPWTFTYPMVVAKVSEKMWLFLVASSDILNCEKERYSFQHYLLYSSKHTIRGHQFTATSKRKIWCFFNVVTLAFGFSLLLFKIRIYSSPNERAVWTWSRLITSPSHEFIKR